MDIGTGNGHIPEAARTPGALGKCFQGHTGRDFGVSALDSTIPVAPFPSGYSKDRFFFAAEFPAAFLWALHLPEGRWKLSLCFGAGFFTP